MANHEWLSLLVTTASLLVTSSLMTTTSSTSYNHYRNECLLILCRAFSEKSKQRCLCGAKNCRGVLGPKPNKEQERENKAAKAAREAKKAFERAVNNVKRKAREVFAGDSDEDERSTPKRRKTNPKDRRASGTGSGSHMSLVKSKKRHSVSATMTVRQFNDSKAKKTHRQSMPAFTSSSSKGNSLQNMKSSMKNAMSRTKSMMGSSKGTPSGSRSSSLSKPLLSNNGSTMRQAQLQFTSWGKFIYADPEPTVEDEMRKIAEGKGNITIPKRTSSLNAAKAIERVVNQDKRPGTSKSMKGLVQGAKVALQGEKGINKAIRIVSGAE
jgi:hypothetical protein